MKRKVKIILISVVTIALIGAYSMLNTRFGVHLALDVISEIGEPKEVQTSDADGPIKLTSRISPIKEIQLPDSIQQPSGIKHRNSAIYISTDQTEIFKLDSSFKNISEPFYLLGGPLLFKQGSLEGIEVSGDKLYAIGEFGSMPTWLESNQNSWTRTTDTSLPAEVAETEFSGITESPQGRFATSEGDQFIFNLDDGSRRELLFNDFLKDKADIGNLSFSGIAYGNGYFYILSESHTSVIVADAATFQVKYVFGIEACAAADLSFH